MKWATPICPAVSSREPASTYAAMETERADGSRALITRGPAGSAVRSNIAGDGTGLPRRDPATAVERRRRAAAQPARIGPPSDLARAILRTTAPAGNRTARRPFALRSALMSLRPSPRTSVEEETAMAASRFRLLPLMAAAVLMFGACSSAGDAERLDRRRPERLERRAERIGRVHGLCRDRGRRRRNLQIPEVEAGKFNVAMVLIGPHDDGGWSQAHYEGLQYLCQNMPGTHIAYIELVPEGADSEQVFRSLSRKGFNFIIGTSFGYMDYMETVSKEFPDITYLHLTGYKSNGKNFGNFFGAVEDMKYLAGMLAGSRAKKDGNPKIGYMATFPIPEELRLGNAIMRGAKQTCPECTMDVRFINTWHDPQKEREAADSLFAAGADVVFTGADTPAVADAALAKNKWAVTYDHPTLVQERRLPDGAVLDLGPRVRPHREAGPGQDLQGRLRVLRRRLEGDGPVRLHGRPDAPEGRRRPAGGRPRQGQGHPGQDAGRHVRAVRRLRRADQGQHRQGAPRRPARSSSSRTSTSSRPGRPGNACKTCMYWWNDGITVALPKLTLASHRLRPAGAARGPFALRPPDEMTEPRRARARARGARHRQGLPRRRRQRPRRLRPARRRDPRAARRERRRQEHAHEHPGRPVPARCRRDPARRPAGRLRVAARLDRGRASAWSTSTSRSSRRRR